MQLLPPAIPRRPQFRHIARAVYWLAVPAAVFLLLWVPVLLHFHVPGVVIADSDIAAARQFPSDDVLSELQDLVIYPGYTFEDDRQIVSSADRLLQGEELVIPAMPVSRVHLAFDPGDLDQVPPLLLLPVAGLAIPDILLRAYRISGRDEFFQAARRYIIPFAEYDRSAWLPRALQWNDHVTAVRLQVLVEFWRLYRHRPDFRTDEARILLEFAARTGAMLANPERFTAASNHGLMQNIALLHLRIAFPKSPWTGQGEAIAYDRLHEQLRYYVDSEGVVLEHSAGYHFLGVEMLGRVLRFLTLVDRPIPPEWIEKYEKAKRFYAQLRRPDGTLAVFGATDGAPLDPGPRQTDIDPSGRAGKLAFRAWPPARPGFTLYPVAGYAISWDGAGAASEAGSASQTVSLWSYFPGHAHKAADELSVLLWAAGRPWWGNTGYWPVLEPGEDGSESWDASNAPHFDEESASVGRTSRLVAYADSPEMNFLEMERVTGRQSIRRQVVHLKNKASWIVLDDAASVENTRLVKLWTAHPSLTVERQSAASYTLRPGAGTPVMQAHFLSPELVSTSLRRASLHPFGGWLVMNGIPQPASAVVDRAPGNAWSATVWSLDEATPKQAATDPQVTEWAGHERWSMELPQARGLVRLHRQQGTLTISGDRPGQDMVTLQAAPDVTTERRALEAALRAALRRYPKFPVALDYRYRNSVRLLIVLVLQELFFLAYAALGGRWTLSLRILSSAGWLIGAWFLFASMQS